MSQKLHVKTGDTVVVISGKDKGKQGKITAALPKRGPDQRIQSHDTGSGNKETNPH